LHPLLLQRVDGACNGKIGLAGPGRADTKIQIMPGDGTEVVALTRPAPSNKPLAGADTDFIRRRWRIRLFIGDCLIARSLGLGTA